MYRDGAAGRLLLVRPGGLAQTAAAEAPELATATRSGAALVGLATVGA